MIEIAQGLPDNVVIATGHGTITSEDYEKVLIPAVDAASGSGKLRMLYVLGEDFEGFDAGAALDDTKLGLEHWREFDRIGVVTHHTPYRAALKAFGFLLPGEVRLFDLDELAAARQWVTAG
jgi:hypothetical protein